MKTNNRNGIKNLNSFKTNLSGWILVIPTIFMFVFLVWRPIIIGIVYSFFDLNGFEPSKFVGLENFRQVLSDTNFIQTLKNTVFYVIWSLILGLPLPFVAAVMMNEMMHAKQYFKITTYLPAILPGMAVYLLWRFIYGESSGGLINSLLYYIGLQPLPFLASEKAVIPLIVIMMTWSGFGGTLIMYLATLQGVNQSLYEAARIDGAGFFRRIATVTFPHCRGIILLLAVRQIISVFSVTEQPMVMTGGGPAGASMSLGLTNYYYAFKYGSMQKSLALGVITFVLLVGLTLIYFKLDKKINE